MNKETKLTEMTEIYVKQMLLPKEELALQTMELMTDKMISENNWNELKEWLEDKRKFSECGRTCISGMIFIGQNEQVYTGVIKKMQEIEGGVDNE